MSEMTEMGQGTALWGSAAPWGVDPGPGSTAGLFGAEAGCCARCQGPVDPFLVDEVGLVLHRTIRIPVDGLEWKKLRISSNDRLHPQAQRKRVKVLRELAVKAGRNVPQVEWARVLVFYRFPTNHRRDVANLQPTSKAIMDGLTDAGLLPDDNDKHLLGPDERREPVNGPHQIIVRVYRRGDEEV